MAFFFRNRKKNILKFIWTLLSKTLNAQNNLEKEKLDAPHFLISKHIMKYNNQNRMTLA